MDINFLLSFKDHLDVQNFFLDIIDSDNIVKNYNKNDKNKYFKKPLNNSLKKEISSVNKFNLILNKLSETNFNNIIIEFIENINFLTFNEYNEFQKIIYLKILTDINYIDLYLRFLELINYVYNTVLNYNLNYILELVNIKFNFDYLDIENDKFDFINNLNINDSRINNIILIKNLFKYEIITIDQYNFFENFLLDNLKNKYISDIYYWKPIINEINIFKLKNILKTKLNVRDKILIENLINNDNKTELNYIIDNYYLNNNSFEDILDHINNSGLYKDSISKINLCKKILEFHLNENYKNVLLDLLKKIINYDSKIIDKNDIFSAIKLIKNYDCKNILDYFS